MSDTKSGDDKTLTVNTKKTLTLKRPGVEQGTVRQNFSHGRTKSVVVETKKRKFSMPGDRTETGVRAPAACLPRRKHRSRNLSQQQPAAPKPQATAPVAACTRRVVRRRSRRANAARPLAPAAASCAAAGCRAQRRRPLRPGRSRRRRLQGRSSSAPSCAAARYPHARSRIVAAWC